MIIVIAALLNPHGPESKYRGWRDIANNHGKFRVSNPYFSTLKSVTLTVECGKFPRLLDLGDNWTSKRSFPWIDKIAEQRLVIDVSKDLPISILIGRLGHYLRGPQPGFRLSGPPVPAIGVIKDPEQIHGILIKAISDYRAILASSNSMKPDEREDLASHINLIKYHCLGIDDYCMSGPDGKSMPHSSSSRVNGQPLPDDVVPVPDNILKMAMLPPLACNEIPEVAVLLSIGRSASGVIAEIVPMGRGAVRHRFTGHEVSSIILGDDQAIVRLTR